MNTEINKVALIPFYKPKADTLTDREKYIIKKARKANLLIEKNMKDSDHSIVPFIYFTWGIVSPRFSGKTNLLFHLMYACYKGVFTKIYLFCPTANDQPLYKKFKWTEIYKEYTDAILREIVDNQDNDEKPQPILLIFDDCLLKPTKYLDAFTRINRHKGISIIYITQYLRQLSPMFRSQMSAITLFRSVKDEELKKFEEFHGECKDKFDILKKMYDERSAFLTYNMGNGKDEYIINLKQVI